MGHEDVLKQAEEEIEVFDRPSVITSKKLMREIQQLRNTINDINNIVILVEDWCADQGNGMTDGSICIGAMKDVRRKVRTKINYRYGKT